MTENTPAIRQDQSITAGMSAEQIELIKATVCKGATTDELKLFLYTANRTGLDPLTKQIHAVKRWDSKLGREVMSIQTGIDGYRAIAERTGTLAGIDDAVFEQGMDGKPAKATVTVYRMVGGTRVPFTASARWSEYKQEYKDKSGTYVLAPMWKKMPYLMLAKCAEALALRKAFPNDLSGVYTNEEMSQADNDNEPQREPVRYEVKRTVPAADDEAGGSTVRQEAVQEEIDEARRQQIKDILKITLQKPARKEVVKELTGLDMIPENYEAIIAKLQEVIDKSDPLAQAVNE